MNYKDELYHVGVKGMRWRNRKGKIFKKDRNDSIKGSESMRDKRVNKINSKYDNRTNSIESSLKGKSVKKLVGTAAVTAGAAFLAYKVFGNADSGASKLTFNTSLPSTKIDKNGIIKRSVKNIGRKVVTGANRLRGINTMWVD